MPGTTHAPRISRLWILSLVTMGTALLIHVLSTALWWNRLPRPVATHWGFNGVADGTGSIWMHLILGAFTIVLLGVVMSLASGPGRSRGMRGGEPLLAGLGNGLLVGICAMFLAGLAGQLDAAEALGSRMNMPVLAAGLALAILWGIVSARLVRKSLPAAETSGEAAAAVGPASGPAAGMPMVSGTTLASAVRSPTWVTAVLAALLVGMLVLAVYVSAENAADLWLVAPVFAIVVLAGVVCLAGRVVADDDGIRVYGGGIVKLLHVRPADIHRAEGREITPAEFGGWGLRVSGAGVAFIVGKGPGVVVERKRGGARIYSVATMDDATAMARLLNQLAPGRPDAGSRT
ncbi:DUF1648 domain-containing protein [Paeniglutamicibacter sp. NPDC012692]|uniref:DUF1648 domain-containing protein n=1 Tax=Paeniglutamicibacter sp. NPDC012692 TaxID=3364388 RepID=UPI00367E1EE6